MALFSNTVTTNTNGSGNLPVKPATTPLIPQWGLSKSTPATPAPSTPLKSQTIGADGSVTHVFHPESTGTPKSQVLGTTQVQKDQPVSPTTNQPALFQNGSTQKQEPPKFDPQTGIPTSYGRSVNIGSQSSNQNQSSAQKTGAEVFPNNPIGAAAYDQAIYAPNLRENVTNSENALTRKGIALPFLTGQQQALEQTYSAEIANQAQKAQALGNIAGYGQPAQAQYGQTTFNPLTGQYGGANGVGANGAQPGDPMYQVIQSYAKGLADGTIPYNSIPGQITSNPVLNNQLLQASQGGQNQGSGFNLTNSLGTSNANQQIAATKAGYETASNQAKNQATQLDDFIKTYVPNPDNASVANFIRAAVANNFSDPKYQQLKNYVDSIGSSYDEILGSGSGDKLINGLANGQGIADTIKVLDQQAQAKISGTTSGSTSNTSTNGGTTYKGYTLPNNL